MLWYRLLSDGNAARTITWQAATQGDCSQIPGATWTGSACQSTFLLNAGELLGDGAGNENGLCESNETCVVTANVGFYQGHGSLSGAGSIGAGGAVETVTLQSYASNGY